MSSRHCWLRFVFFFVFDSYYLFLFGFFLLPFAVVINEKGNQNTHSHTQTHRQTLTHTHTLKCSSVLGLSLLLGLAPWATCDFLFHSLAFAYCAKISLEPTICSFLYFSRALALALAVALAACTDFEWHVAAAATTRHRHYLAASACEPQQDQLKVQRHSTLGPTWHAHLDTFTIALCAHLTRHLDTRML